MKKSEIIRRLEDFAPLELAEKWDCSGWAIETSNTVINRIMLALTVTEDVICQAKAQNCDMIIPHHPLFYIPLEWKNIDIYSAHTNLDKAEGGTTDTLIKSLNLSVYETDNFLRYVILDTSVNSFIKELKRISSNLRYVNTKNITELKKIAFCAGSGSEFIQEAFANGADAFVTGDLKFHTALESPIVLFDIGHFESEILVLSVFERIIGSGVEVVYAKEKSPFEIKC